MKLLASALLMLGLTAPATAQWSYIGQTMCYTVGGVSQCESVGTVFNYALNRTDFISTFSTFYRPFVAQPPAQSNPTYQAQNTVEEFSKNGLIYRFILEIS